MIDKPMLILPLPDGFKSSGGMSPLTVLVIVGFFIYLDQRYGFTSVPKSDSIQVNEQPIPTVINTPYEPLTPFVDIPEEENTVGYISEDEEGNVKRIVAPKGEYWLVTTTDNARIRRTPERKKQNALGMLDMYEKVLYVDISDFTETFRRSNGETVDGYWIYVFRPKTNSYGWIHEINLAPYQK